MSHVTADITGKGQWTEPFRPAYDFYAAHTNKVGFFNVSVQGSGWSATIELQRSFDDGATWHPVETFTSPTEKQARDLEDGVLYRLGIPSDGTYSSGTIPVRLGK